MHTAFAELFGETSNLLVQSLDLALESVNGVEALGLCSAQSQHLGGQCARFLVRRINSQLSLVALGLVRSNLQQDR